MKVILFAYHWDELNGAISVIHARVVEPNKEGLVLNNLTYEMSLYLAKQRDPMKPKPKKPIYFACIKIINEKRIKFEVLYHAEFFVNEVVNDNNKEKAYTYAHAKEQGLDKTTSYGLDTRFLHALMQIPMSAIIKATFVYLQNNDDDNNAAQKQKVEATLKELEMCTITDLKDGEYCVVSENSYGGVGKKKKNTYEAMTVKELQERCVKRKIKYSGLRKAELIAALRRGR